MTIERALVGTTDAAAAASVYVEDVFSTYLYTGTGAAQTINNGIDLATKGGLVWIKQRNTINGGAVSLGHYLLDTDRGGTQVLASNNTNTSSAQSSPFVTFNNSGFALDSNNTTGSINFAGSPAATFASWTFRKQAKFFDIVTYTGTGSARTIAHALGATPGMIIVKRTDTTGNWKVYHNGLTSAAYYCDMNTTAAQASDTTVWNSTAPTSSVFSVGTHADVNASGGTYVAYLFADSNSGGFGPAGTDSVVACGSYTTNSSYVGTAVNLGWEPQFLIVKDTLNAGNWYVIDNMRGWDASGNFSYLRPNNSTAEGATSPIKITATGFQDTGALTASSTVIYLAIRRPMKTPTDATKVFAPVAYSGTNVGYRSVATTNTPDTVWWASRNGVSYTSEYSFDRLRGVANTSGGGGGGNLAFNTTDPESPNSAYQIDQLNNKSVRFGSTAYYGFDQTGLEGVLWSFTRAPGFFDVVCYTGTGANTTVAHNLGVVPELMIVKCRSAIGTWIVYHSYLGNTGWGALNSTNAGQTSGYPTFWNSTTPTASSISLGTNANVNTSAATYVAYLFASCPGVSKVGSYTGTGAAQNINCGFTAGARFVLIKRVTGGPYDWFVYDSARGINASGSNDPYLLLNSTAAEVTTTDYLGTYSSGFALTSSAPADLNASGVTYLFLAIA